MLSKLRALQGQPIPAATSGKQPDRQDPTPYGKRDSLIRRKLALTREPLEALFATCDESLRGWLHNRTADGGEWFHVFRRSGFVTEAGRQNNPMGDDWAFERDFRDEYLKSGEATIGRAARLLQSRKKQA